MSIKLFKDSDGNFRIDDGGKISEILKIQKDNREGHSSSVKMVDNSLGIKYFSLSKFDDDKGYVVIDEGRNSGISGNSGNSVKMNWEDFLEDDEREYIKEIKDRCLERMERMKLEIQYEKKMKEIEELKKMLGI